MADELPPGAAPEAPRPEEEDDLLLFEQPPSRSSGRRWLVGGLIAAAVLGLCAIGVLLYLATSVWQRNMAGYTSGLQPATPPGQGPFTEVTRYTTKADIQALGGGDVDGDGQGEAVTWVGKDLVIRDRTGRDEATFPSGLKEVTQPPGTGSWVPSLPVGGIRRPLVGVLQGKPAIVVTDGEGESVYGYRADGGRVLDLRVANSHARCLTVADLNGDGESEILVGRSSSVGLVCSDAAGKTLWKHGSATDPSWVCVGDGNGDGTPEVFVGYDTGPAQILDASGTRIGEWPQWFLATSAECADLDGDKRADFLLTKPQTPGGAGGGGSGGTSSNPYASLGLGTDLMGISADGREQWSWPLMATGYTTSATQLGHADLNLDGKGEWIASGPDGTVRVYDVAGNEIGNYAMGKLVQTLGVVPGAANQKPQVWVGLSKEVVVLEWQ